MELMGYVAEQLSAQKHSNLEYEAHLALLAKTNAARPSWKRAFAFKLWNVEVTVRTARKTVHM
ncbi:hypothetical protein FE782_10060 [Paenibacillus antri]|uniref:Uncharacterized protein n=1 Tax=Paenibacillus antri TaxID=2582848 RepID=A0A5R9GB50_9BACL|nr:hypothetical protein [Paenibacillus antri]TLS52309.1 hypothetical protein FE782_10060 [Paenibacillus antri]